MALLLLANLAFWGYTRGHLAWLGVAPAPTGEPQRLAQQVAPEALTVLNAPRLSAPGGTADRLPPEAADVAAVAESAPQVGPSPSEDAAVNTGLQAPSSAQPNAPTACWQLGGLTDSQTVLLRGTLSNLPELAGRWTIEAGVLPARWIVYLGKFADEAALQRRRAELRQAGIDQREVNVPALRPGLALGTYSSDEAAERALAELRRRGVANARVVQERDETRLYTLRLPAVTEAQRRQIESFGVLGGRPLQRCP